MSKIILPAPGKHSLTRRRFVQGLGLGAAWMGLGLSVPARADTPPARRSGLRELRGNRFELDCRPTRVNFTGTERLATAINGSVPGPVLRWREGDTVTLRVTNNLAEDSSIHWHGIILPNSQDGVPHIAEGFPGIPPGETFTYRFPVRQSGTYWYHSHSGFQEQTGAQGAIVIDPLEPEPFRYDRDYVVMLSDWSDEGPNDIYAKLKKHSDYYNRRERTVADALREIRQQGWDAFTANRAMWNEMRMSDRDISDVTGYTYTFLINGVPPAVGWLGLFERGDCVRLRFINSSAMTFFDVRIPGLKMTVVAADGQYIEPVSVDEFRIGVAETYDVLVEPKDDRAYTIFAQAIDRSGYARGTLTPEPSWQAEIPPLDPAPTLSHSDMGMSMGGMHRQTGQSMAGMDHSGMAGMDHSQMTAAKPGMGSGPAGFGSALPVTHDSVKRGPQVDMLADDPQYRLDDPGIGLRNNGRQVLTYADICRLGPTADPREPEREISLHLTGNMERYMWSIDGVRFADAEPLRFRLGERLRINLINDTMMSHPIHLHGMWSDLETGDPARIPRKHTVVVQPGARISYLVSADATGSWAYHCHLLYHMPGMFRTVVVS